MSGLMILVAGPYRSGTDGDPAVIWATSGRQAIARWAGATSAGRVANRRIAHRAGATSAGRVANRRIAHRAGTTPVGLVASRQMTRPAGNERVGRHS